ncbi:hypothetical protein HBI88_170540 [Parastagonospora nodorum]|nr:hypothetical protein HBI10_020830 [Parastagonospora nodorum]KAH4008547.1 hypothetical protein HBI13_235240 [Parastagonospora nodorum]KAH4177538.1 hypothetical protein HBH43_053440 [Parastagonospora nodorum]KAH5495054.1 hypothetical protein HBI31_109440 [Parastagonospora nodorum]KAH5756309.1 hypothetical protein HBI17_076350 [Parastagonospora nodorum]
MAYHGFENMQSDVEGLTVCLLESIKDGSADGKCGRIRGLDREWSTIGISYEGPFVGCGVDTQKDGDGT